jgi:O-antigen/teichoic acid export membrane protein
LFGTTFQAAYPVLLVLSASQTVVALVGTLAGFFMIMTGHQNQAGVIIGGTAALNLALTFVLTPRYGPIGTATATLIATAARSAVLVVYIRRRTGITILPLPGGARG